MLHGAEEQQIIEDPQTHSINIKPDDHDRISNLSKLIDEINGSGNIDDLSVFVDGDISEPLLSALVAILPQLKISKFSLKINSDKPQNIGQLIQLMQNVRWKTVSFCAALNLELIQELYTHVSNNEKIIAFHLNRAFLQEEDFNSFSSLIAARPILHLLELSLHHAKISLTAASLIANPTTFLGLEVLDLSWNRFVSTAEGFNLFCLNVLRSDIHTLGLTAPFGLANTKELCDALVKMERPFILKLTINADVSSEELDAFTKALYLNPFLNIDIDDTLDHIEDKDRLHHISLFNAENAAIIQEQTNPDPSHYNRLLFQRHHSLLLANYSKEQLADLGFSKAIPPGAPTLLSLAAKKLMQNIQKNAAQLEQLPAVVILALPSKSMTHHLSMLRTRYDETPLEARLARLNLTEGEACQNEVIRKELISTLRSIK